MTATAEGLRASIRARLVRHAKVTGLDSNVVFTRYAIERFLYRLSRSRYADRFVLKGALLMLAWLGETLRPTRDADLLGFGEISEESLLRMFTEVCATEVEPDGIEYLPASIRVAPIRKEDVYGGLRAIVEARLGTARLQVQVDVGIGDAVTPEPQWLEYPGLLDLPRPRLQAYRPETAIAEKFHAMVVLGEANSRMRDFFDIHVLAERELFEAGLLARAVRATFERRGTPLPIALPLALTREFGAIRAKQIQWQGFLRKSGLKGVPAELSAIVARLAEFLETPLLIAREGRELPYTWLPGGPWRASTK